MMKQEFERLIGKEVSPNTYEKIETVYMSYPGIKDKQQIADLYMQFGMVIIEDLLPRAKAIQDREEKMHALKLEIESYKKVEE